MHKRDDISDPELIALGADVRVLAPAMSAAFEVKLSERVAAGFPRERRSFKHPSYRRLAPIAGLATIALVAATVAVVSQHTRVESGGAELTSGASLDSAPTGRQGAAADPGLDSMAPKPVAGPRKVERSARLTLTASADDVQNVANGVARETQKAGGYVQDSSISTDDSGGEASFALRIPTKALDATIASLSKLANVGSLSQESSDITAETASAKDRLADAQGERKALLRVLSRADTPGAIAAIRQRLSINRQEIAKAKSGVRSIGRRASLSTVYVDVQGDGSKQAGGGWSIGDALSDALGILGAVAGALIVALATGLPIAVLGAAAWFGARVLVRRRRESSLR